MEKFLDIIDEFNDNQKEYLALRVIGFDWKLVVALINLTQPAIRFWRACARFLEIENLLIEHRAEYLPEAQAYFSSKVAAIDYALLQLAHRIIDWDSIEKIDKPYVMKAVEMVKRRFGEEAKVNKKDGWLLEE